MVKLCKKSELQCSILNTEILCGISIVVDIDNLISWEL